MLRCNVKDRLIFEIPQIKICLTFGEVVEDHLVVVVGDRIMNWQVSIIILGVQLWPDILHNIGFAFYADNVLDLLTLVILLTTGSEEVVVGF